MDRNYALLLLLLLPLLHQCVRAEVMVAKEEEEEDNKSLAMRKEEDDGEPKQIIRVGPENTQVRLGENVYLCCIVDHQKGKAQWTKDGFALGFNRTVPGYPRYRYVGNVTMGEHHLVIRGATIEDEGEYECQVGPSATNEAVWSGANVTVMVPPRKNVMVGWGNNAVAEVMEGTKLKLECLLLDAKPAPTVAWYRNNLRIDPSHHYEVIEDSEIPKMVSVRSHLVMRTDARDDGHKFSCHAIHPAIMYGKSKLVSSINLAVFHPPGRPVISEYHTGEVLRAGENRILVCHVFGGNPIPKVMWFRHGRPQNQVAAAAAAAGGRRGRRDGHITSAHPSNPRKASGGVFVSQQVIATREEDGAIYECRVSSDLLSRPYTTNVTLTVHYPPEHVEVRGPAAVAIGEDFSLTCVTAPASPAATIAWAVHGTIVSATTTTVTEHAEGGWVTTSKLDRKLIRTEEIKGLTEASVECKAEHQSTAAGVRGVHIMSILERPGEPVVEVEGDGQVTAGDEVTVLCTTRGGNPMPDMKLFKGDELLEGVKVESDGTLSWARVTVRVNASDNGAKVTCEATNLASSQPATGHTTLDVNFAPWEIRARTTPKEIDAGQIIKVTCETSPSVPASTVTWRFLPTHEDITPTPPELTKPTSKHLQGLYGGTVTRSKIRVKVSAEDKGRVLRCEADNGLGLMVATNITIDVLHGPKFEVKPLKKYDVKEGGNLTITAFAQANPGPVSYKWRRGSQVIEGETTEDGHGVLTLKNLERHQAGNYSVTAGSFKGYLPSFFTVNVLYAPQDIVVQERVLVEQNATVSIKCRASGNPTPNVTWTRASDDNGLVLASGLGLSELVIEGASKSDTGFYLCHAFNLVSAVAPAYTALVVTQAPSTITAGLNGEVVDEEEGVFGMSWAQIGGGALLDCRVKASPEPRFNWTRDDGLKIITSHKYVVHVPQLIDGVAEWSSVLEVKNVDQDDLTNFTCQATNPLGSHISYHALSQPAHPGPPLALNVTVLSDTSALVQWTDAAESTQQLAGYTIRFRTDAHKHYEMVDVPGTNASNWLVEDLIPGSRYSFTIQSYNIRGRPYHTSPTIDVFMSTDGEMEDKEDDGDVLRKPEGMPLLMFVLIALTGGALCILNVTGALCFLRRRAFFNGFRVSSTRKASDFEVPSPSLVDQLSLSSCTDDIPPPDYEVTPPLHRQQVMSMHRDSFGGSMDDILRRQSRSSRGTPSLARSSPMVTSSSTISAAMDIDTDDIIAPPEDFCNGLMSSAPGPSSRPRSSILRLMHETWTSLDDGHPITEQVCPHQSSYDLTITHQPSTPGPRPVERPAGSSTFHYSMESLSSSHYPATPRTPQPTPTVLPLSSQVTYHGQPHIQQQHEQQQSHQYHYQQQLHFQYPPAQRASPPFERQPSQSQRTSPTSTFERRASQQQTSPPLQHTCTPPLQHTCTPPSDKQPLQHTCTPPYDQQPHQHTCTSPPQQTSPPFERQPSQRSTRASPPYERQQQKQQQQQYYQASGTEASAVPPPYASLDPSTLYSIHPTYFDDTVRPGTSYSGQTGRTDNGHS